MITELARVRSLVVRPSSVIARYQGQQKDPREIGKELSVSAVLTAGFIHAGERFRVTAQLIDVGSGELLWSDRIDTAASDIIVLQDTIAQRIVEGLRVELSPAEQDKIATASTQNPAAYEQYLRGRDLFARFIFRTLSPDDCDGAIAHFERAIQLDPNFALAHDGLGACYVNRVFKGFGGSEDYERAEAAFTKALAIDPNLFEARMLMVFVYLWRGQKEKARDEVNRARREAPNEPVVHFVKALLHRLDGEYGRALRSYDRLVRLDPAAHVVASYSRALVHMYMGHFDETFRQLDNAGEPDNALVRTFRALALYYTGQTDAAAELMKDVVEKHPNMHGIRPFMAMFLSAQGKHDEALAQLTPDVKRNGEVDADISYSIGSVYALEGLHGDAFEWLERSISLGNANRPCFENDPNWASLREDPRFIELIAGIRNAKSNAGSCMKKTRLSLAIYLLLVSVFLTPVCRGGPLWPPVDGATIPAAGGHRGPPLQLLQQQPAPSTESCCEPFSGFASSEGRTRGNSSGAADQNLRDSCEAGISVCDGRRKSRVA